MNPPDHETQICHRAPNAKLDLEEVDLTADIFNCVICFHILKTPIILVDGQGNMCRSCCEEKGYEGIPNSTLEAIVSKLKFPCAFRCCGCDSSILHNLLHRHQKECIFRSVGCQVKTQCAWIGPIKHFPLHIFQKHKEDVVKSEGNNIFTFELNLLHKTSVKLLINVENEEIFLLRYWLDGEVLKYAIYFTDRDMQEGERKVFIKHVGMIDEYISKTVLRDMNTVMDHVSSSKINLKVLKCMGLPSNALSVAVKIMDPEQNPMAFTNISLYITCPICANIMNEAIYMCPEGHSICQKCLPPLQQCPICRTPIIFHRFGSNAQEGSLRLIRNYALENLIQNNLRQYMEI